MALTATIPAINFNPLSSNINAKGVTTTSNTIETTTLTRDQIKEVYDMGIELAIVIGGGNIFRGLSGSDQGVDRVTGDHMGMLATVINSLALQNAIEKLGVPIYFKELVYHKLINDLLSPRFCEYILISNEKKN